MRQRPDNVLSRREFIQRCAIYGIGAAIGATRISSAFSPSQEDALQYPLSSLKEAAYWEPLDNGRVRCRLCPNMCECAEGEITRCRTRINRNGKLYSAIYGKPCVLCVDPLSKTPLYHADPGANAVGTATAGCNLTCKYCQNWDISQVGPWKTKNMDISPEQLIEKIKDRGVEWVVFSYTEPVAYYEYAIDIAKLAKRNDIHVAVATAGFISAPPLAELIKYTDAFSVTIKGYSDKFCREICGCKLEDVMRTVQTISKSKCWLEVVTLIVPGLNDDMDGLQRLAYSIVKLNRDIPFHFLRFSPAYKLKNLPLTPVNVLEKARRIALAEGIKFVYINMPGHPAANTYCPSCSRALIERSGFAVVRNDLKKDRCPACSCRIPGFMLSENITKI